MPIVDAIQCEVCGMLVALSNGRKVGKKNYRCSNCYTCCNTPDPCFSSSILYTASPFTPKWVEAIGVVLFCSERGQTLSHLYPPLPFSLRQETDLAFLCFPDANSTDEGEYIHHFMFPFDQKNCDITRTAVSRLPSFSSNTEDSRKFSRSSISNWEVYHEEYFCSSLYRQQKDPSSERGAQQRAVVLISVYPFPHIFEMILGTVSTHILQTESPQHLLQLVYDDICSWPAPLPTKQYTDLRLFQKPIPSFCTPYYGSERFGPCWCEDGLSYKARCFSALTSLLEALEDPCRDCRVIQSRLDACVFGPMAIDSFGDFIDRHLKLQLVVSTWKWCDCLAVIEAVRMRMYEGSNSLITPTEFSPELLSEDSEADAREMARHFRHIVYVSSEVATIQNRELFYDRRLAKHLLESGRFSVVELNDTSIPRVFPEFDLHDALFPHLNRLWKLWELLITGESLCIVGDSVSRISAACFCLYSLLAPLPLTAVIRPYVTINNSEVDCLRPEVAKHLQVLVGATNPFFVRHWMDWPHFLFLSTTDEGELQTRKTLPCSSSKRKKHQFDMKANMFTSKHFLIKSEKCLWENSKVEFPTPTRLLGIFLSDDVVNRKKYDVDHNTAIRQTFYRLTKRFLQPLDYVVEREFSRGFPFDFYDSYVPSEKTIFAGLERCDNGYLPLHMFKQRHDMFAVYRDFMKTATYRSWIRRRIFFLKRDVVLRATCLESILLMEPDPSRRYTTIMALQRMLNEEVRKPLLDVVLLRKLLKLTACFASLRVTLSR